MSQTLRRRPRQQTDGSGSSQETDGSTGRRTEIDKMKRKGLVGAALSLFILQFNAFALFSCATALLNYFMNVHVKQDVDLFKTVLPQFTVIATSLLSRVVVPLICRTSPTKKSRIQGVDNDENGKGNRKSHRSRILNQATLCNETILKCFFNLPLFYMLYSGDYFHPMDFEGLGESSVGIPAALLGTGIFLHAYLFRRFLLKSPAAEDVEEVEWDPTVFSQRDVRGVQGSEGLAVLMKCLQVTVILPICDAFLFRCFFYHRLHTVLPASFSGGNTDSLPGTYIDGSQAGNLRLAFFVSLLNSAYDNKYDTSLKALVPGLVKGMVFHAMVFSNSTNGMGYGIEASIVAHAVANAWQCAYVIFTRQWWQWP